MSSSLLLQSKLEEPDMQDTDRLNILLFFVEHYAMETVIGR